MEAVVALGIAGNAVQFLDFATKLCAASTEIYRDASGASIANKQSQTLVRNFIDKIDEISKDVGQYFDALATASSQASAQADPQISLIIKDCQIIAQDLSTRLAKLKAGGTHGRWKSFLKGLECMWKKNELNELEGRLKRNRSELEWRILLSMREGLNLLASRQEDQFREVQVSMVATLSDVIRDQISLLPPWPKVGEKPPEQNITNLSSGFALNDERADSVIDGPVSIDQDVSAHTYAENCAKNLAQFELQQWKSLYFSVLNDREDQIIDAERETFEWILRPPRDEHQPWSNFTNWLTSDNSIFWIQGKAGSGKSTMLKFLSNHPTVKQALDTWADKTPLVFVQFYFWHNGSMLQKTQEGLLRTLLYQALRDHRELIPAVFPETTDIAMGEMENALTLPKLKAAFRRLLEQKLVPVKLCLMIDGLDEYRGDHTEIVAILRRASTLDHVKMCVTSRPLLVFERAFKGVPGLVMQHLTFDDINIYVKTRFRNDERFQELELEEPGFGFQLALQVVSKASGVFLWVRLVIHSLLEGILNFDRSSDLFRRLDELPDDLEDLYQHMLDRVKPPWYLEEGLRLLRLVQASNGNLTLLRLAFVELGQTPSMEYLEELTVEKQEALCRKMAGRIKSRCLGLIEVSDAAHVDITKLNVGFLHKSVSDFIDSPKMIRRMQSYPSIAASLLPTGALLKGLIIELQTVRSRLKDEHFCIDDDLKRSTWYEEVRPLRNVGREYLGPVEKADRPSCELMVDIDDLTGQYWDMVKLKDFDEDWRTTRRSHNGMTPIPLKSMDC